MSLRDRPLPQRPKWPIEFDLEGIPRDDQIRQAVMRERELMPSEANQMPRMIDLNNPPKVPYHHQEFPKIVYHKDGRILTVDGVEAQEQAEKDGFALKPFEKHDYSYVVGGKVAARPVLKDPGNPTVGY